jgi:cyclic pyranopterin phosphate synthase
MIKDKFNRTYSYLRVSLTHRCNFSCNYCNKINNPIKELNTPQLIDIIEKLIKLCHIEKVRLTGGEPLLREDIDYIIYRINRNVDNIGITTNGYFLKEKIFSLYKSGLKRINISLDSLNRNRFKKITNTDHFNRVIDSIMLALSYGLKVKINSVLVKGLDHKEIDEFIRFSQLYGITIRFIELMPFSNEYASKMFLPSSYVIDYIEKKYNIDKKYNEGVAKIFEIQNAKIGFITSVSTPFCSSCNRLRLTSDGKLYRCLFDKNYLDLSKSTDNFNELIKNYLYLKKEKHNIDYNSKVSNSIRVIGG